MVELIRADQLFETILQYITDPIVLIDKDFKILWANKTFQDHSGYKINEIIGNYCYRLNHNSEAPCKLPYHLCPIGEAQKTGKAATVTHAHFDEKGNELFVETMAYPVKDEKGKIIQFVCIYRDITERKRAEESLKVSETRYRRLFETAQDGILILDADTGQITDVNPFLTEMLGYFHEEFLGKKLWDIGPFKNVEAAKTSFTELQRKRYIRYEHLPLETKGGRTIDVEFVSNVYLVNGKKVIQCNIRDVTERKQAEEEIQELNKELEQKLVELTEANRELDAFNYTISHDLKATLMIIGGFAQRFLNKQGDKLDTKDKDMLNAIHEHTQEMERLIKDLLAFSHVGSHKIKPTVIDMENLVASVLDELKPLSEGRTIKYDIKTLPTAHGDKTLIKQVVINLLSNAIKFTTNNKMAIIEVGGGTEENKDVYYVKDNGMGFNSQDSDKLFTVFQRLHGIAELEGTGVGLSIVQRIVNRHGGRVWAQGKVNEGATFYFSLPNKVLGINNILH
jgi:PAS domain S-box-containing protein